MNRLQRARVASGSTPAARRGSALVETALLMIILIPLLLYSVFLSDAVFLKLELQESVVSGLWDFSTRNTEAGPDFDQTKKDEEWQQVAKGVRGSYSDHTSSYEDGAEPDGPGYNDVERIHGNHNHWMHHQIYFAAQFTYRFGADNDMGPDTEFKCTQADDTDWAKDPIIIKGFANADGKPTNPGGKIKCDATGFIYNYILPQKLFKEFHQDDLTDLTHHDANTRYTAADDAHDVNYEDGKNIKAHEGGSLYYNTWALKTGSSSGQLMASAWSVLVGR